MLTAEAKREIREVVRDELHQLLDRGSEIQTTNDRLWSMRNDAHREIELLRGRNTQLALTNADQYVQLDRMARERKADQEVLRHVIECLSGSESHTACVDEIRARIRDV